MFYKIETYYGKGTHDCEYQWFELSGQYEMMWNLEEAPARI